VTTKYNPARTWTVENVVGIGGAYMCIYGMEGPGGYQLFGRTAQVWNTYRQTKNFGDGKAWLLRFFDQIRFFPVSSKELLEFRNNFIRGRAEIKIEPHVFKLKEYNAFLEANKNEIAAFRDTQQQAFAEERERWKVGESKAAAKSVESQQLNQSGQMNSITAHTNPSFESLPPENSISVDAHITGNVWKVLVKEGDEVVADAPLFILESMKMEFTVLAPSSGVVKKVLSKEGNLVTSGQALVYFEAHES